MLGFDKLVGRFTNVMEDELKQWCERVIQHHLKEGEALGISGSSLYHLLWPIRQQNSSGSNSSIHMKRSLFLSSLPEDLVSTIRLFIEFVMSDEYGGVDERGMSFQSTDSSAYRSPGGLRGHGGNKRPTRRRNGVTSSSSSSSSGNSGSSQHSKLRVSQFQSYVLGAVASTLVWTRDVISSIVLSHCTTTTTATTTTKLFEREKIDQVLLSQFDSALVNDCVRVVCIHIPSMEEDFASIISDAALAGIDMSCAYHAYVELMLSAIDRIEKGIFEV